MAVSTRSRVWAARIGGLCGALTVLVPLWIFLPALRDVWVLCLIWWDSIERWLARFAFWLLVKRGWIAQLNTPDQPVYSGVGRVRWTGR